MSDPTALDPHRLPRSAVPQRYDVLLRPDLDAARFSGSVRIQLDVVQAVHELVLNSIELEIHHCVLDGHEVSFRLEPTTERLFISVPSGVGIGAHTLEITFDGILNDRLHGFYRSTYRDANNVERVVATTQLQATDCRRAFPCWDEPDFKAVFGISLEVDPELLAISNAPEIDRITVAADDRRPRDLVRFADTMVMSTYLVAFIVGPLEATDVVDVDGVPMRVIHVPGKAHLTRTALEAGAFSLRWFQDYYGIAYPGEKVDLVALPDFAAGAMENLGCITFREALLLIDPTTATQAELQNVVDVIAHELAHMWFGDLVTMRWWNGIWLNEAFATFMELAACDAYRPDWHRWTAFGTERSVAFETDALATTRSVEFPVRSPADCQAMFDVLTYQKGGALLRMLEQHLGPERFREGVNHYLHTHAYANTETNDLWDALEATSGEPVRRLMDSWIWQPGFPVVSASIHGGELVLEQSRFSYATGDAESDGTRWIIPVAVRQGERTESLLLDGDVTRWVLHDDSAPVIVNAGGHGFFRVAYGDELLVRLSPSTLRSLDTLERYCVVDDAWNAVVASRLGTLELLDLLDGFSDEDELAVWQAIVVALRGLGRLLDDDEFVAYQGRVATLVRPAVERLGEPQPDESDLMAKLRGLLVGVLAVLGGDEPSRSRCRSLYERSRSDPAGIDPELLAAATMVLAATGGDDDYETVRAGYRRASTPQDQLRHLDALAEFDHTHLIARTCEFAMSPDVKSQDAPFLLGRCIANRRWGRQAWEFVASHWDDAVDRFPGNTIVRMVAPVRHLNRPDDVADVQSFFDTHPIPQGAATLAQTLERQRVNAALRAREGPRLAASLRS